jgi:predicted adenine nucleotide alpha hydrolase (AANH) superfamily ATPase
MYFLSLILIIKIFHEKKFCALERRFTDPNITSTREYKVLKALQKRVKRDLKQSEIIMNYLEEKYEPTPKRVKFNTLC